MEKNKLSKTNKIQAAESVPELLSDIRRLIVEAKQSVITTVNATQTMHYWHIGKRINQDVLKGERAEYGKQIVLALAGQLSIEFGKGFAEKSLRRMVQFAECFPEQEIVASVMRQLSWTHFTLLIPMKNELQREFYAHRRMVGTGAAQEN